MKNLRVYAKQLETNEKVIGTGINLFDNQAFVYDKQETYEVNPETIVLRADNTLGKYENPITDNSLTFKLHEKLVQTVIDFMLENNITDIDEVWFNADSLQISKQYHKWSPATDSALTLIGYQDGERRIISESI